MARKDDEREFRLRPAKPRARREGSAWATGFKLLIHYARSSRSGNSRGSSLARLGRAHNQRCAVRIVYSKNTTKGQWRAHGRYLARENATLEEAGKGAGFTAAAREVDIAAELERWQAAHDPLLWKLIISPEFGDRADLHQLTRDLIERMSSDLKTGLEWVAVAHHNTEHPHVHVALRGVTADGNALKLDRQYIKAGVRNLAEELCTLQLGYRTELDAAEAERREIFEKRFTSLDRLIIRRSEMAGVGTSDGWMIVGANATGPSQPDTLHLREQHVASRLAFLETMGIANRSRSGEWRIKRDFESVLKAMQRTTDRQKTLSAHGALASDDRLPIRVLEWQNHPDGIQGRILVHGQDDFSGRNYLMLEGTDAQIHFVNYTPEMEVARSQGQLRTNSFVKLQRILSDGRAAITDIQEFGDADTLLMNRGHFRNEVDRLMSRGVVPTEDGWGGWLGKYQASLRKATVQTLHRQNAVRERKIHREYGFDR